MERIKRQQNDIVQDYHGNKKGKWQHQNDNTTRSFLENLPNEILYEIFEYLDIYHIYNGFFNLNKRFKNVFLNSNLPIQINISTISKSNFQHYHRDIIIPNKHRINYLRLSNPFIVDIIFSPPRVISTFVYLQTFILDNIKAKYLNNILNKLYLLPKLHSLVLILLDYILCPTTLFFHILRLPKLKYCKITYQIKNDYKPLPVSFNDCEPCSIEHLVINSRFPIGSFNNLLFLLPKLRYLSIDCLVAFSDTDIEPCPFELKDLQYVFLNLDPVYFNHFEKLVKNFFYYVQVLHVTTKYDSANLDAKRWEQLISFSMPNLRIFDINYNGHVENNSLTYNDSINQFKSSFWIEKQWFFTYQHDSLNFNKGIFYSTLPYRRKDYTFYEEFNKQIFPEFQETNLDSVKHVFIRHAQALDNYVYYFPNAIELSIIHGFRIFDDSFITNLHRVVPLEQLTKLVFDLYDFPFEQFIELLRLTSNLHTLKLNNLSLNGTSLNLLKQSETFQYISIRNKIKRLEIRNCFKFEQMPLFVDLFPRLEYFKIEMNKKEIEQILRFLFTNRNDKLRRLVFLCIASTPKRYLSELNMLIKSEHLLDDYFIKFINRDLYLWW